VRDVSLEAAKEKMPQEKQQKDAESPANPGKTK
jgi:hypothetical protein